MAERRKLSECLLAFGSNLGDGPQLWQRCRVQLGKQLSELQTSRWYVTRAVGPRAQPPYLNAVFRGQTDLAPLELLRWLRTIEHDLGRHRGERWGARTVDLDLLLYDGLQWTSGPPEPARAATTVAGRTAAAAGPLLVPELELPHPRLSFRQFVLRPACDVAANWRHPTDGTSLAELLSFLNTRPACAATADRALWDLLHRLPTLRGVPGPPASPDSPLPRELPGGVEVTLCDPLSSGRVDRPAAPVNREDADEDHLRFAVHLIEHAAAWAQLAPGVRLLLTRGGEPDRASLQLAWHGPRLVIPASASDAECLAEIAAALAATSPANIVECRDVPDSPAAI